MSIAAAANTRRNPELLERPLAALNRSRLRITYQTPNQAISVTTNSARLTTANGDVLTVWFVNSELRVNSGFGKVALPVNSLRRVSVSAAAHSARAREGLVAWWSGENNGKDSAGGNIATLTDISFAEGEAGRAFSFNGSSSLIVVPASPSLDVGLGAGFTIETWVNPANYNQGPLLEWNNSAGGIGVHLWLSTDVTPDTGFRNLYANVQDTTGTVHAFASSAGIMNSNEFQHVALTYSKVTGVAVLYRNGIAVASQNLGSFTPQTSYDLYLGYRPYPVYFTGTLDAPAIYNRALSEAEIREDCEAGHSN